jgi:hypothetical protein
MPPGAQATLSDLTSPSVAGYLRAHRVTESTLLDPAPQNSTDYLRAHRITHRRTLTGLQDPAQHDVLESHRQ